MDARYFDATDHPEFTPNGNRIMWKKDDGTQHWTRLYTPSKEAREWDGALWANSAVGIRNIRKPERAAFAYCQVKTTGRKVRTIPGTGGVFHGEEGIKATITFNKGTVDESTFGCWIV